MTFDIKKIGAIAILIGIIYFVYNYISKTQFDKKFTEAVAHYRKTYDWLVNMHRTNQLNDWARSMEIKASTKGISFEEQAAYSLQYLCEQNPDFGPDFYIKDELYKPGIFDSTSSVGTQTAAKTTQKKTLTNTGIIGKYL